jgi:hypothetical protein
MSTSLSAGGVWVSQAGASVDHPNPAGMMILQRYAGDASIMGVFAKLPGHELAS